MKCSWLVALALLLSTQATAQGAKHELNLRDVRCVAHIIFGEARDEPEEGQYEVAWSMRFRQAANLPEFGGNDLCAVAYKVAKNRRKGKTIWQYDGAKVSVRAKVSASKEDKQAWERSVYIAAMMLQGQGRPSKPIMYFCDRRTQGACNWHNNGARYAHRTGNHRMYTDKRFPEFSSLVVLASTR